MLRFRCINSSVFILLLNSSGQLMLVENKYSKIISHSMLQGANIKIKYRTDTHYFYNDTWKFIFVVFSLSKRDEKIKKMPLIRKKKQKKIFKSGFARGSRKRAFDLMQRGAPDKKKLNNKKILLEMKAEPCIKSKFFIYKKIN